MELYKMFYGKMMAVCRRYFTNKDDAMEVLNHGFLKVYQNLEKYRFEGVFEGWVYTIIYRTIMDYLKEKALYRAQVSEELPDVDIGINPDVVSDLHVADLMRMLEALPEATRVVFNMYAIEGYKHNEIATMLDISEGTSKWHVNHARKLLKEWIENNKLNP